MTTINGKTVLASGTLVLGNEEAATITLPFATIPLSFLLDGGPARTQIGPSGALEFYNCDDALGVHGAATYTPQDGTGPIEVRFAIWCIGDSAPHRVVHYTAA